MKKRARRRGLFGLRGLGASEDQHIARATQLIDSGWSGIANMPPTCEGGIQMSATNLGRFDEARAHLQAVDTPSIREANAKLYGLLNMGFKAAWEQVQFFSQVCKAPHREAAERPSASKAKAIEYINKREKAGWAPIQPKSKKRRR